MQGIGRATALLFAKKGFNVVVAARDLQKLQYVAHDCAQAAGRQGASLAVQCDVTNERDVKDLATAVMAKYENVDVVSHLDFLMPRIGESYPIGDPVGSCQWGLASGVILWGLVCESACNFE